MRWRTSTGVALAFALSLAACPDLSGFSGGPDAADAGGDALLDASAGNDGATGDGGDGGGDGTPLLAIDPPVAEPDETIDVTNRGTLDWLVRDPTGADIRCASCVRRIGALSTTGPNDTYSDDTRKWSWSNGSPVVAATSTGGVFVLEVGSSFLLSVDAAPARAVLTFYADTYGATGKLTAQLVGTTLAAQSVDLATDTNVAFKVHFAAPASAKLSLTWTVTSVLPTDGGNGNVAFSAATLAPDP